MITTLKIFHCLVRGRPCTKPSYLHNNLSNLIPINLLFLFYFLGGIEVRGMKASLAPRRQQTQSLPKYEKYQFIPYESSQPLVKDSDKSKTEALTALLQIVLENSANALKLKIAEIANDRPAESTLAIETVNILESEPMVNVDYTVVVKDVTGYNEILEPYSIKTVVKDITAGPIDEGLHLVIANDLTDITNLIESVRPNGFILLDTQKTPTIPAKVQVISMLVTLDRKFTLLRKTVPDARETVMIPITENNFKWVEPLKAALVRAENEDVKVYVVTQGEEHVGLQGLVNALRQEPGGNNVRQIWVQDPSAEKLRSPLSGMYKKQMDKDLVCNIYKNGNWGSYRHMLLENPSASTQGSLQVEHAYVNTLVRGDLASLKWIEGPLSYYK